jgi:gluconate 2-dehydrogenase alpha chain
MARRLPRKDVVIIGLGWTGSILAHEMVDAGLDVVAIERGPWRDTASDFSISYAQDELRYRLQHELFLQPSQTSVTFRNNVNQTALPVRTWGAFMLGNGAGGAGVHWNGETWRFLPTDFVVRSHLTQRYGAAFLPEDMTIQDWGVTFDELEPHYDQFEYLCGTSGTAGNVNGMIHDGGNPFEGPRSRPYPTPAQKQGYGHTLFAEAARQMGYKPFPQPSGNLSQAYTNPLGVKLGQCTFCGF